MGVLLHVCRGLKSAQYGSYFFPISNQLSSWRCGHCVGVKIRISWVQVPSLASIIFQHGRICHISAEELPPHHWAGLFHPALTTGLGLLPWPARKSVSESTKIGMKCYNIKLIYYHQSTSKGLTTPTERATATYPIVFFSLKLVIWSLTCLCDPHSIQKHIKGVGE